MLDLSNLIAPDGTRFEVHLENSKDMTKVERQFGEGSRLLDFLVEGASSELEQNDLGKGRLVHAMFNADRDVFYFNEAQYAEWLKDEVDERNWHSESDGFDELLAMLLGGGHSEFSGPDAMLAAQLFGQTDENAIMSIADTKHCAACPVPEHKCRGRHANFERVEFDKAVAEYEG